MIVITGPVAPSNQQLSVMIAPIAVSINFIFYFLSLQEKHDCMITHVGEEHVERLPI